MTFAAWKPSLVGEPWEDWMDSELFEDFHWGCTLFVMAKRCRRTLDEIQQRLAHLGLSLDAQPKRKIRRTDWTRRARP